jgi:hypothetical protein
VRIGSREQLNGLVKGLDARYGIIGLGEIRWMLGMLVVVAPMLPWALRDVLYLARWV